jgi:proteasome lid subunit RPN8/RPN11
VRTKILGAHLRRAIKKSVILARSRHWELAGVLVSHGGVLGLYELRNVSRRRGHFELRVADIRSARSAAAQLGSAVVGTWHSHVVSEACPSPGDIADAQEGSLLLIIDTIGREAALWRVRGHRAYSLRFDVV